jgi:hypothetical protein
VEAHREFCVGKPEDPGGTGANNRMFVEAVLWIARTGSPSIRITLLRSAPLLSSSMVAPCQSGLVERLATPT